MTPEDDELQGAWKSASLRAERGSCPSSELMASVADGTATRPERQTLVDHLALCATCTEEYRVIGSLQDWARRSAASLVPDPQRRSARVRDWFAALGWPGLAVPAAVAAAIALAIYFAGPNAPAGRDSGGTSAKDTRLPSDPGGATTSGPSSQVVATLTDGTGRVSLTADGHLTTPSPLPAEYVTKLKAALLARVITAPPQLAELTTGAAALMGADSPAGFALIGPVATMVATDRPTLRWSALPDGLDYEVTISDVSASYREVASSGAVRGTRWTVPRPLARGRTFSWQVVARTARGDVKAPAAADARFQVVSRDTADRVSRIAADRPDDHLMLGIMYAEAGLLDEADAQFQALAKANPASTLPRELALSLRKLRQGQK